MFKNTLQSRLYRVIFPIEDLRQTVDTAQRIPTKEKIDRKSVLFNSQTVLDSKIDKITALMSKLTPRVPANSILLNPKFIKEKGEEKEELICMTEVGSKAEIGQTVETDSQYYHIKVDHSMKNVLEEKTLEEDISGEETQKISETTTGLM